MLLVERKTVASVQITLGAIRTTCMVTTTAALGFYTIFKVGRFVFIVCAEADFMRAFLVFTTSIE